MNHLHASAYHLPRITWPPLLCGFTPATPSFAREARYEIDHSAWIPAPPDQVYDEFSNCPHGREWVDQFVRLDVLTPDAPPDQRVYDESFTFMTVRVRTLEAERGRRWLASIDRCTFPIAKKVLQVVTFEPVDGGTNFRWRLYYTPSWIVRPFLGLMQRLFDDLFRQSTQQLAAFFRTRQLSAGGRQGGPSQQAHAGL
ncbi:MAG TPA: SRPBCC family protein [Archangium sp.]